MARPSQQQQQQQPESGETQSQTQLTTIETPSQTQTDQTSQNQSPITLTIGLPLVILIVRLTTLVSLITSLIIITSNNTTLSRTLYTIVKVRFKDIHAYRYMVWCIVIGLIYSCLQVPFAIYRVSMGKPIVIHPAIPKFDFYADKVILSLLATGVGAAFGATADLKKKLDDLDDYLQLTGDSGLSQIRSKLDDFFTMGNVATGFLLIAFLSSGVSSVMSSLALSKK